MLDESLRNAREGKGWTRDRLASEIGGSPQVIKRLEAGVGSVENLIAAMHAVELRLTGIAKGATLPDQVRHRRTRLGLTVEAAAEKAGISRSTLVALERGTGTIQPLIKLVTALAPGARASKPAVSSWSYDRRADRDKRFTPTWFLRCVEVAFGDIDIDPCAHELAAVRARRKIMLPEDGLTTSWAGSALAYVNPPFSHLVGWLNRAMDAFEGGECQKIVMLVPTRTDSSTFHRRVAPAADIAFLQGRMTFDSPEGLTYHAPFAMMSCIFGATEQEIQRFAALVPATWMLRRRSTAIGDANKRESAANDFGSACAVSA